MYDDKDIPQKLKIFLPNTHKKKLEEVPREVPAESEIVSQSFLYEFEGNEEGEDYSKSSVKSEATQLRDMDKKSEVKTEASQASMIESGMEGYSGDDILSTEEAKERDVKQDEYDTETVAPGETTEEQKLIKEEETPAADTEETPVKVEAAEEDEAEDTVAVKTEEETPKLEPTEAEDTLASEPVEPEVTPAPEPAEEAPADAVDEPEEAQAEG